jgi:hypothetical protein
LTGALKGAGLRSAASVKVLRKLLAAGHEQAVLESVAEVLLSEAIQAGRVAANAGKPSQDFAMAVEAEIVDVVREYHEGGNPLTSRFVAPEYLVSEMCKQWLAGFAAPISETLSVPGQIDDPEVSDRLAVVALAARDLIRKKADAQPGVAPDGNPTTIWSLNDFALEDVCRSLSIALFLAFKHPNDANHEIIHGKKP